MEIKVLRAFCVAGLRQEVGAVVDLPEHTAIMLCATGQAERFEGEILAEKPKRKTRKETENEHV